MRLAPALALAFFAVSSAHSGDAENVLRQLPLKGMQSAEPEKKEAPLPAGVTRGPETVGAPAVHPFILKDVVVEGATVFDAAAFRPQYNDYLLRTVGASELAHIAEAVTAMYRDAGYFLSRAIIPAQDVAGGRLRIQIVEGYIDRVSIEGDGAQELAAYASDLLAERPARLATLERTLYLMGDVAGIRFKSSRMAPDGDDLARHKLIISADRVDFDASFYSDNRGRPEAGELQAYVRAGTTSLVTFGDRLSFGFFFVPDQPEELLLGEANYVAALGHDGATLNLNGSLSRNDQGDNPPGLKNESDSTRFFGQFTYPLIRARDQSLWLHAGVEKLHIRDEVAGALSYRDDLAIVHAAATLRQTVWNGVATVYLEVADGFEGASKSVPRSRPDADGRFVKGFMQATLVQNIGWGFAAFGEVDGQVSDRPLLSAEEFALGGSRIGRGYNTGEIAGEDGVGGVVELRFSDQVFDWLAAQLYGFYDAGIVWNDNAAPGAADATLNSTGVGVRFNLPHAHFLSYEAAKPLTRTPAIPGDKDVRHFFSLSFAM